MPRKTGDMTNQMITARGLTMTFRSKGQTVEAVRSVDLSVQEGELVAFLGPSGAGKSTTLRMLTTLLPPTSGEAVVAGGLARATPVLRVVFAQILQGRG